MAAVVHGGNVWQGETPGRWLDFSANLRPEGSAPWAMDAACRALSQMRFYPDPQMRAARQGLAEYLGVPPQCVLPTAAGWRRCGWRWSCWQRRDAGDDRVCAGVWANTCAWLRARAFAPKRRGHTRIAARCPWRRCCHPIRCERCPSVCNPTIRRGAPTAGKRCSRCLTACVRQAGALLVDEAFIDFCPGANRCGCGRGHAGIVRCGLADKIAWCAGDPAGIPGGRAEWIARAQEAAGPWPLKLCGACQSLRRCPAMRRSCARKRRITPYGACSWPEGLRSLGARVYPSEANFLLADFGVALQEAREALRKQGILVRACESFALLERRDICAWRQNGG